MLAWDLQPSAYCFAVAEMGFGIPAFRYQLLVKTTRPAHQIADITRDERDIREALETIFSVLRAIHSNVRHRARGWQCGDCQVRWRCDSEV